MLTSALLSHQHTLSFYSCMQREIISNSKQTFKYNLGQGITLVPS